jgi:hypothetical protein
MRRFTVVRALFLAEQHRSDPADVALAVHRAC